MKHAVTSRSLLKLGRTLGLLVILVALGLTTAPGLAQSPITPRYSGTGYYGTVANGVGLDGVTTGNIALNVPGTPIAAFLYWSGFAPSGGGDSVVELDVNTVPVSTDVYADSPSAATLGPSLWFGTLLRTVYVADVTSYIQTGAATYTISDFVMTGAGARQDGAGLVVVYENTATQPYSQVTIQDGLSIFFPTSNPPQTFRHSDTACVNFPADTVARSLDYSLFVGGLVLETPPALPRTNALWSYTGTGTSLNDETPPRNIIDVVDPTSPGLGSQPPIAGANVISGVNPANQNDPVEVTPTFGQAIGPDDHNGDQWDTYRSTLNIPANDTFACFQIQTFHYITDPANVNKGSSGNWMALIGRIPLPTTPPTAVPPTTVPPTPGSTPVPGTPAPATTPVPTTPVAQASGDPVVSKVPNPQNVVPGELVTWQVTITNPTGATMNSVRLTDPLDASFFSQVISANAASSAVSATISGLSVIYDIPQILPGETLSLTLVVRTRTDLAPGTVGTNFVIIERPGRPTFQTTPVSLSMIRRLPSTGYPPR